MKSLMLLAIISTLSLASCASNKQVANNEVSTEEKLLDIAEKAQSTSTLTGENSRADMAKILNDSSRSIPKDLTLSDARQNKNTKNKTKK